MQKPKQCLPQLKSMPPKQLFSPRISSLLVRTSLGVSTQKVIELSDTIQKDLLHGYQLLVNVDASIDGVGLHNVNRQEGDLVTGAYRTKYRALFRPIQYVYKFLSYDDLAWNARYIVLNSCLHVEKAVKYRFSIPDYNRDSLGVLIGRNSVIKTLEVSFLEILKDLNKSVYGKTKHTIEHVDMDAHDFSPADAITVYLSCRWVGTKILEPTGLFNTWKAS